MIFSFWVLSTLFLLSGSLLAVRRLWRDIPPNETPAPVSILKPLRGEDPGLLENLETFFRLRYPCFELVFSVAHKGDPAAFAVKKLLLKYPQVRARLVVSGTEVGLNPKVNNLLEAYRAATHELLLISDSNIRVEPDYLSRLSGQMRKDVGVLTSVVVGKGPVGLGGELEAGYLNTFYARAMNLGFATGNPFVIGKSMMFRRRTVERFGGMEALADYIAEDYAFGQKVRELGLRVELAVDPVIQHVGRYSVRAFWERHTRWGKIRRAHAPWVYLAEPISMALPAAVLAGLALEPFFSFGHGFTLHLGFAALCDAILVHALTGRCNVWAPAVWLLRELCALPLWFASALNSTVNWRGHKLTIQRGGTIKMREGQCKHLHSSGERPLAPTRLRAITSAVIGGSGRKPAILREG